jgi:hypothetical protein
MTRNKQNKTHMVTVRAPLVGSKSTTTTRIPVGPPSKTISSGAPIKRSKKDNSGKSPRNSKQILPQYAVAQIDPFAPEAFGAKIPDMSALPTAVAFSRNLGSLSTSATVGGIGVVYRADPTNAGWLMTPVSGTTWTIPAAFAGGFSVNNTATLNSAFAALRPVAFGVKISCRQAYTVATGLVHIALVPDIADKTTFVAPLSTSGMAQAPYYRRVPLADLIEDDVIVAGKVTDDTAFKFLDPTTASTNGLGNIATTGWSQIMIWVEGAVSVQNIIDFEIIWHWECMVGPSGTTGVIEATEALPYSPGALAATKYVAEHTEPVKVVRESQDDTGTFWRDVLSTYRLGVNIANGFMEKTSSTGVARMIMG